MVRTKSPDVLAQVPLFRDFSARELKIVRGFLREEWFNAGEDIVREGEQGNRFYIITEGRAKVISNGRTKATIGPGGYFGEMSLIDGMPRAATVRADTQVKTVWIGSINFQSMLRENWSMNAKILRELSARLREADARALTH